MPFHSLALSTLIPEHFHKDTLYPGSSLRPEGCQGLQRLQSPDCGYHQLGSGRVDREMLQQQERVLEFWKLFIQWRRLSNSSGDQVLGKGPCSLTGQLIKEILKGVPLLNSFTPRHFFLCWCVLFISYADWVAPVHRRLGLPCLSVSLLWNILRLSQEERFTVVLLPSWRV